MMRAKGSVVGTGARVSRARSTKDFDDRGRNFGLRRKFRSIRGETGPDDARRGVGRGRWMSGISREFDAPVRGVVKCVHKCRAGCAVRSRASKSDTGGSREAFFGAFSREYFVSTHDAGLRESTLLLQCRVSPKIRGAQTHRPGAGSAGSCARGARASARGSLGAVSVGPSTHAGWKASPDTPPRCVSASSWSESCPRRTMIW